MNRLLRYLILFSVMVTLAGCPFGPLKKRGDGQTGDATEQTTDQQQQEAQPGSELTPEEESAEKFTFGSALEVSSLNDPNSPLSQRVLYFDLDSSQIKDEDRDIITVHAEFLAAHADIAVVLEGHADERGSREYNIALGEKRAKAIKQLMTLQGVTENQIQVISFGEERPVALGHDAAAWNLNRRVEILYSGY